MKMQNVINEGRDAQAALPIAEITVLLDTFVRPVQIALLTFTVLICVVSGISILVSIYNSMSDRRHEIAVMRALGAGRGTIMTVVLLESIILSLGGGLIGWIGGHGLIGLASPLIEAQTGVAISMIDLAPGIEFVMDGRRMTSGPIELWLIPGLILLAIAVGFLPAVAAYRTDVAKSLGATP